MNLAQLVAMQTAGLYQHSQFQCQVQVLPREVVAPVPIPSCMPLFGIGLIMLYCACRRGQF